MIQWLAREMESPGACGLGCSAQPSFLFVLRGSRQGGHSGPSEGGSCGASTGRGNGDVAGPVLLWFPNSVKMQMVAHRSTFPSLPARHWGSLPPAPSPALTSPLTPGSRAARMSSKF